MFISKPFMVEFSGTPEAGKTTTIMKLADMLQNRNYKVMTLKESAESLPSEIPKGTFDANMWMHLITQAGVLKAIYSDADIVLIDRGVIDSEFYGEKYLAEKGCTKKQHAEFKRTFLKYLKPDLFMALMVTPEEAIKRRGGEGRLVNKKYIQTYNKLYLKFFGTVEVAKNMLITDKMTSCEMSHEILNIILKHLP